MDSFKHIWNVICLPGLVQALFHYLMSRARNNFFQICISNDHHNNNDNFLIVDPKRKEFKTKVGNLKSIKCSKVGKNDLSNIIIFDFQQFWKIFSLAYEYLKPSGLRGGLITWFGFSGLLYVANLIEVGLSFIFVI